MATLDLPGRYRRQLIPLFEKHIPDAVVWAYGSRVTGRSHAASDLDLVVRNPSDLSQSRMWPVIELREAIRESNLPILVDVLDWAAIPQSFRDEIERIHVVMYAPGQIATEFQHASPPSIERLIDALDKFEDFPERRP